MTDDAVVARPRGPDEAHVPQPTIPSRVDRISRAVRMGQQERVAAAAAAESAADSVDDAHPPFRRLVTPSRVELDIERRIAEEPTMLMPHFESSVEETTTATSSAKNNVNPQEQQQQQPQEERTPSPTNDCHTQVALPSSEGVETSSDSSGGGTFFSKLRSIPLRINSRDGAKSNATSSNIHGQQQTRRRCRPRPSTEFRVHFDPESSDDNHSATIRREIHLFDNAEFISTDSHVRKQVWYSALELRAVRQANLDLVKKCREVEESRQAAEQQQKKLVGGRRSPSVIFRKLARKSQHQDCLDESDASDDHTDTKSNTTDDQLHDNNNMEEDEERYLRGLEHYWEGESKRRRRIHSFVASILQAQAEFRGNKKLEQDMAEGLHHFCRSQTRGDFRRAQKLAEMDQAQIPELAQQRTASTAKEKLLKRMSNPVSGWFSTSHRSSGTTSSWSVHSGASSAKTGTSAHSDN